MRQDNGIRVNNMPSIDVLEAKVISHETELERLKTAMESKVSYQHFYWVIGILATIQIAVFGYIIQQGSNMLSKIDEVGKTAVSTKVDVSELKGKLDPYQIEFQNQK